MKKLIVAGVLGLTALSAQAGDLDFKAIKDRMIKNEQFKIMIWEKQGLTVEVLNLSSSECNTIGDDLSAKGKKVDLYKKFPIDNTAFSLGWYQNSNGDYVALNCVYIMNLGSIIPDIATEMKLNVKVTTTANHLYKLIADRKILEDKHNAEIEKSKKDKLKDLGLL
jgi:hypothetical protein